MKKINVKNAHSIDVLEKRASDRPHESDSLTLEQMQTIFKSWANELAVSYDALQTEEEKQNMKKSITRVCGLYESAAKRIMLNWLNSDESNGVNASKIDVFVANMLHVKSIKFKAAKNDDVSTIVSSENHVLSYSDFLNTNDFYSDSERKFIKSAMLVFAYNFSRVFCKESNGFNFLAVSDTTFNTWAKKHNMLLDADEISRNKVKEQLDRLHREIFKIPASEHTRSATSAQLAWIEHALFEAGTYLDEDGNVKNGLAFVGAKPTEKGYDAESVSKALNRLFFAVLSIHTGTDIELICNATNYEQPVDIGGVEKVDKEDKEHSTTDAGKPMTNSGKLGAKAGKDAERPTEKKATTGKTGRKTTKK